MADKKEEAQKPDVEIHSTASFDYLHARKSGKISIRFHSNQQEQEFHESYRQNLPEELQDGETYTQGAIRSRVENSIREDPDETGFKGAS